MLKNDSGKPYEKIRPLPKRDGDGTYDQFWDMDKYDSLEKARKANDTVIIDFVKDEKGIIYFEFYHTKKPEEKTYYRLEWQHFPFGVDTRDDNNATKLACEILSIWK